MLLDAAQLFGDPGAGQLADIDDDDFGFHFHIRSRAAPAEDQVGDVEVANHLLDGVEHVEHFEVRQERKQPQHAEDADHAAGDTPLPPEEPGKYLQSHVNRKSRPNIAGGRVNTRRRAGFFMEEHVHRKKPAAFGLILYPAFIKFGINGVFSNMPKMPYPFAIPIHARTKIIMEAIITPLLFTLLSICSP